MRRQRGRFASQSFIADDGLGYAQQAITAERNGEKIDGHDVLVMRFQDDKIAELRSHPIDSGLQERMFS